MACTYVLKSLKDGNLYIGSTRHSVEQRMLRHNRGQVSSTKGRGPFIFIHSEDFDNYSDARKREIYFKSGSGKEHLLRVLDKRAGTQVAKGDRL